MHDVMAVVAQRPPAMGQAEHAVALPVLPREQARAAGRAGRRRAERLAEQHALVGERLHVGHRHLLRGIEGNTGRSLGDLLARALEHLEALKAPEPV